MVSLLSSQFEHTVNIGVADEPQADNCEFA